MFRAIQSLPFASRSSELFDRPSINLGKASNMPQGWDSIRYQLIDTLSHTIGRHDFKTGVRKNAIMAGMAQPLTDAEMRALANFYASQPSALKVIRDHAVFVK